MYRRILALSTLAIVCALSFHVRAEDFDFKWQDTFQTLPQTGSIAKISRENNTPLILTYPYSSRPLNATNPAVAIPRFSSSELGSLGGIADLGATPPQDTRFDMSLSSLVTTAPSAIDRQTNQSQSLSDKMLATPPLLHDAAIGLGGTSQYVLPARYLNDGHQFLNR
jgi:hypothetical protein